MSVYADRSRPITFTLTLPPDKEDDLRVRADAELSRMKFLFPQTPDTPAVLPAWRRLVVGAGVSGKQVHDARLLAALLLYGIGQLLTFNTQDFTRCALLAPAVQIADPQTA